MLVLYHALNEQKIYEIFKRVYFNKSMYPSGSIAVLKKIISQH